MKKLSALLIAFCLIAALICSCSSGPKSDGVTDSNGSGGHYDEIGSDPPKQDGAKDPSSPEQKLIKKYPSNRPNMTRQDPKYRLLLKLTADISPLQAKTADALIKKGVLHATESSQSAFPPKSSISSFPSSAKKAMLSPPISQQTM